MGGGLLTIRRAKSTTRTLKNRGLLGSSMSPKTRQRRQPGDWRVEGTGGGGGVVGDKNCESGWNWNRAEEASFADLFGCWWAKLPATKSRGVNEPTFHAFCLLARLSTHTYGL